jgi:hypothetical protein
MKNIEKNAGSPSDNIISDLPVSLEYADTFLVHL